MVSDDVAYVVSDEVADEVSAVVVGDILHVIAGVVSDIVVYFVAAINQHGDSDLVDGDYNNDDGGVEVIADVIVDVVSVLRFILAT